MKHMKVSMKLILSFLIVAAMAAIVGGFGIIGLTQLQAKDTKLYESNLIAISAMSDFREAYQQERTQLRTMILAVGDPSAVQTAIDAFAGMEKTINDAMITYEATIEDKSLEDGYYAAKEAYLGNYATAKKGMMDAALAGDAALAYQRLLDAGPVVAPIVSGLQKSATLNDEMAHNTVDENTSMAKMLIIVEIGILLFAIAVAVFFAFYISSLISKPLGAMTKFLVQIGTTGDLAMDAETQKSAMEISARRDELGMCSRGVEGLLKVMMNIEETLELVSQGDLTVPVETLSDKDIMGISMQKVLDNLNNMFGEINASTTQVTNSSKQIADGSQALAQGSMEQAASVQELSSSISDIAEKTKVNAEMAANAANLATTIMSNAEKGNRQMDEMMTAVKEINDASRNINKVIKAIDEIAFQTNILALNASVEAARAGQHGKGFAVVAEEVRNLAAKSAEAAKETGSMIANSIEKAELGVRIADETSVSLGEIVAGINESTRIVGDIARSSEEQSASITQINKGIEQVAHVVQQNSATAEESAAASEEMSGQANLLEGLIGQFKLKDDSMSRQSHRLHSSQGTHKTHAAPETAAYSSDGNVAGYGKY